MPFCLRSLPKSGINTVCPKWKCSMKVLRGLPIDPTLADFQIAFLLLKVTLRQNISFQFHSVLTKSIDAILNKNWFWFCIIPQTQVWPWYNLNISCAPTKKSAYFELCGYQYFVDTTFHDNIFVTDIAFFLFI